MKFEPIGIVDVLWEYDSFEPVMKKAYFEYFIPNVLKGTNDYCVHFVFLENDLALQNEFVYTNSFEFKQLNYNENTKKFKIKFLGNTIFLTVNQYKTLQTLLAKC